MTYTPPLLNFNLYVNSKLFEMKYNAFFSFLNTT